MKNKLAILSPNQNAYSETFIQAHKKLPFEIRYYYGGYLPKHLEGHSMLELSWKERIEKKMLQGFTSNEKRLLFSLKKQKVKVVLAEYGLTAADTLRVIQYLKLPLIVHFHGFDISIRSVVNGYKEKYQQVFKYAHAIISVSNKMTADLIACGCDEKKITLNPYGPSDAFFDVMPSYDSRRFLAVGRFVEKKAPHLLLFAFSKVVNEFPDAHLMMIGEGSLLPFCQDLAQHLHIENNVTFAGAQPPGVVSSEMGKSVAFVQHSVTAADGDSEGTPVAVLEAQAAGLPVIATKHAGIPDVVLHNETGLLCGEKDVDAMTENMMCLLQDKELAKNLGKSARKRVGNHFSLGNHLKQLELLIHSSIQ